MVQLGLRTTGVALTIHVVVVLLLWFAGLEDPGVAEIGDLGQKRQVVATETGRVFPRIAVLVETSEGRVVEYSVLGLASPNGGLDAPHADLLDRTVFRLRTVLTGHSNCPFQFEQKHSNTTTVT